MATQTQQKPRSWSQDISFAPPAATGSSRLRRTNPKASAGGTWEMIKQAPIKLKLMVGFIALSGMLAMWQLSGILGSDKPNLTAEAVANDIKVQLPGD